MNFAPAAVADGRIQSVLLAEPLSAPPSVSAAAKLTIGIRPEWIEMRATPVDGSIQGVLVDQSIGIAGRYLTKVDLGAAMVKVKTNGRPPVKVGEPVHLIAPRDRFMLFADGERVSL